MLVLSRANTAAAGALFGFGATLGWLLYLCAAYNAKNGKREKEGSMCIFQRKIFRPSLSVKVKTGRQKSSSISDV